MFEKEELKKAYMEEIKKKLEKAKSSYEVAKRDTIEAEGRMITRYDSSKTETAWLADGRLKEVKELEQYIKNLKEGKVFANISDTIFVDLIVNNIYKRTERYVLTRTGNNNISEELLNIFAGHVVGDVVVVEDGRQYLEYQFREIQKGKNDGFVSIDSVVTLSDEYGEKDIYYIVNYIGGMEIKVNGKDIFCISRQSALAKALLGRKPGEKVVISKKTGAEMLIDELE